jgi:hypothetical protein
MIDIVRLINEVSSPTVYHASGANFDKFDMRFVKSATEMARHGLGVYFVDDYDTAMEYILNYTVGNTGIMYYCKLYNIESYLPWDALSDEGLYTQIAEDLIEGGYEDDGQNLLNDLESYGETISNGSLYDHVKAVVGDDNVNSFFTDNGVGGFTGSNMMNQDSTEYCCLDASQLYIERKEVV